MDNIFVNNLMDNTFVNWKSCRGLHFLVQTNLTFLQVFLEDFAKLKLYITIFCKLGTLFLPVSYFFHSEKKAS